MNRSMIAGFAFCLLTASIPLAAQTKSNSKKTNQNSKPMTQARSSAETVKAFFNAFGNGDFDGLLNTFHDSTTITAVRKGNRDGLYGTYTGKEGVREFLMNLGNTFNTKSFSVDNVIGEGTVAFANGKFEHEVKTTGKSFASDWTLMCLVKEGKILEYHFYEDSQKFFEASTR